VTATSNADANAWIGKGHCRTRNQGAAFEEDDRRERVTTTDI